MTADAVGVVIVEDHELYRDGLRTLFAAEPDIEILGETDRAEEALGLIKRLRPALVLMDIRLPGKSGVEATRELLAADPAARVLVLTMFDDDASVFAAMQAGAHGYVLKGARRDDLLRAVRGVAAGEAVFGAGVAARLLAHFRGAPERRVFAELTGREHRVLELLARRLGTADIARALGLSPKTVRNHLSSIVAKLHVAGRAEAAEQARERGL